MRTIIGLDVGGTKTAVVEGNVRGEIVQRYEIPTIPERPFEATYALLRDLIETTRKNAVEAARAPNAISVSIGGPLKIEAGYLIDPPHLPGWHGIPLKDRLATDYPDWHVFVEHDGNAGALAEYYFGIGRQHPSLQGLVFLTFGTGLGAGIIVNGHVVRGPTDTAGEVGHLRLAADGPKGFGKPGSWEGFASGKGLVRLATRRNPDRWPSSTSIRSIVETMLADDPEALEVADEAGYWMGQGVALIIDMLNPEAVVFGTLGVVLGDRVLNAVRRIVAEEALPQAANACMITPATLGQHIGDVASLMAALTHPASPFHGSLPDRS